jgi:hypothetical protein
MTNDQDLDLAWKTWTGVMRKVTLLMQKDDFRDALSQVETFLACEDHAEIRSDALGMKANLKEELGDIQGAKEDLLLARSLIGPSYGRYVHEISLGAIAERQQQSNEALGWYRAALRTCVEGQAISGGTALKKLVGLQGEKEMSAHDQALCIEATRKSWRVLNLPGQPDLADLNLTISRVKEAESKPR